MADTALRDFLAWEELGSPLDAADLGGPANAVNQSGAGMPVEGATELQDPNAYPRDLDAQHARLVRWFEEAERASVTAREEAEKARDYVNGVQWTAEEVTALRARNQPVITINKIRDKVSLLTGMERKSRTDPKAWPRTPNEDQRAEAATQALRYVADENDFSATRSAVYENMLVEGFGGAELGLEDDGKGGASITITHVGWERIWHDPHSRALDFADARYLGMVLWMDRDQLEDMFPDAEDAIVDTFAPNPGSYDDRPGVIQWQDNQRERVRIVQAYWTEGGQWWGATFSRAGFLAEPQQSRFLDRRGRSACPLVLHSAYMDRENRRFGMVRDLLSLQDELNKRRSKALHLLSVNRVIADQGAVDDEAHAQRQAAKPDGWITVNPGARFEMLPGGDLAMGQFKLLEHATMEMQAKGPNAAMSGTDPRDQSGRAILAQQAGGAAANEPLADGLRSWSRRIYEMTWMAVRQYWQDEKFIRVADDMEQVKWLALNRKVTLGEEIGRMAPEMQQATMQRMMLRPGDPRLQMVVRTENEINDLDVDIVIEEGTDVPALQAEQFTQLMQLAGSQPGIIPPDVLIAASSLKDKSQLLKRMKDAQEAQAKQAAVMQPLVHADAVADVRVKESQALLNESRAMDAQHGAVAKVAQVHKMAAESPQLPVGEMQPMQPPQPPGGPPQ